MADKLTPKRLTGAELIAKVDSLPEASKAVKFSLSDLVRAAGYVSTKKDGTERLNFTAFYEALLKARGQKLPAGSDTPAPRQLSYQTTVLSHGGVLVGNAYLRGLGLKPGQKAQILVGDDQVVLSAYKP
jgi:hypothetical protein